MMNLLQHWLECFSDQFAESGLKFSNLKIHAGTSSSADFDSKVFVGEITYWPDFKFEIYAIHINDQSDYRVAERECDDLEKISDFIAETLIA